MAVIPVGTYDLIGFGEVDFTIISLATAARVAKKLPYLVLKNAPAEEKKHQYLLNNSVYFFN